ncbi:MAG: tetratricopeptide repeat protein [Bryobacterales bacterium]|nr:tetratricopeptide repeat protein [Bryobacterales bacterium]
MKLPWTVRIGPAWASPSDPGRRPEADRGLNINAGPGRRNLTFRGPSSGQTDNTPDLASRVSNIATREAPMAFAKALLAACLISVPFAASGAGIPPEAASEFNRAVGEFRSGNYEAALRLVRPLEERHPEAAEIQHLLAIVLDLNGIPLEANRHFKKAVSLQPGSVSLRTNYGASLMRIGRSSEAAEQFRKALELDPDHATASFNLGTILLQQGRPDDALPKLEKAFSVQPSVYQNAYQLAYCRFLVGDYRGANTILGRLPAQAASRDEARFLKALTERALGGADRSKETLQSIRPRLDRQPQLQFQAAILLLSQGLLESAEELLSEVTRRVPSSYAAHLNLARARRRLGRLPEARLAAKTALSLEETAEAHLLLGDLLDDRDSQVEAVEHLRRAVELEPVAANYYALGHEFLIHWNWETAAEVFTTGLARHPRSWDLWVGKGGAAMGQGQFEVATAAFLKAVELRPDDLVGYHLLSQAFDQADDAFDGAVLAFQGLFERNGTSHWARYYEALATFRQAVRSGDYSDAAARLDVLRNVVQEHPAFLEAHLLLGEIQFELREWTAAAESLGQAVAIDANHVTAHYKLGLALQRSGHTERARQTLERYRELKALEDAALGERVAATTRFIVERDQAGGVPEP